MGETAKLHHYVPQFYLRGFANAREQLVTVRLPGDKTFVQPVRNAAAVNHFHTVEHHPDGPDVFETLLGRIEEGAAKVFRKIQDGTWPLKPEDRAELAEFIALQAVRGADFRRDMTYMLRQVLRVQVGTAGKRALRARVAKVLSEADADKYLDWLWEQATGPDGPPVELSAAGHISELKGLVAAVAPLLQHRVWGLYRFKERSLFTSDSPVSLHSDPTEATPDALGFGTAHMVTYPLSRKAGLLMTPIAPPENGEAVARGEHDFEEVGTREHERFFNLATTLNASEVLLHHPDDARFVPEALPDATPINVGMSGAPKSFPEEP